MNFCHSDTWYDKHSTATLIALGVYGPGIDISPGAGVRLLWRDFREWMASRPERLKLRLPDKPDWNDNLVYEVDFDDIDRRSRIIIPISRRDMLVHRGEEEQTRWLLSQIHEVVSLVLNGKVTK